MYDDIATNEENPKPGTIINHPDGQDIYTGVPKDYTGSNITVDKFLAVLLGDKNAVKGGSGKVVDSGPNDHIFVFYLDHGGPGVLGMPTPPYLFARDLLSASSDVGAGPYVSIGSYGYFGLGGYGAAGAVAGAGSLYGLPSGTSGYDRGVSSGLSGYPSTLPGVAGTGLFPGSTLPGSRSYLP